MKIHCQPFGEYRTNCYILDFESFELVIDPGVNSAPWVSQTCKNALAILNTHGHFDHIWDNEQISKSLQIPIICHELDAFLLQSDVFNLGLTPSQPNMKMSAQNAAQSIKIADILKLLDSENCEQKAKNITDEQKNIAITFHHFPGHTPGCCMIEVLGQIFSGDFIFYRSIGRSDFSYSDSEHMRQSLMRFKDDAHFADKIIYPGHGQSTKGIDEQKNMDFWLKRL